MRSAAGKVGRIARNVGITLVAFFALRSDAHASGLRVAAFGFSARPRYPVGTIDGAPGGLGMALPAMVRFTPPAVVGALSREAVYRVLRRGMMRLRTCYLTAQGGTAHTPVQLVLRFRINPNGRVLEPTEQVTQGHMAVGRVAPESPREPTNRNEACLRGVLSGLRFATPETGTATRVSVRVYFGPPTAPAPELEPSPPP